MEAIFNQLQQTGQNNVDNLIKWLKDSKVLDGSQAQEAKVRSFFQGVDPKNIALDKFKEVIAKVASEFKLNLDDIMKKLTTSGPNMQSVVDGATSSVKQAAKDFLPKF